MPGADLPGVNGVIAELVIFEVTVLIAEQAESTDDVRIEIDLNFRVFGDDLQRSRQIFDEDAPRLAEGVNIGVVSVSRVREVSP